MRDTRQLTGSQIDPVRDGTPLPAITMPDTVSQLAWRVLGPDKRRARSVLNWADVDDHPPGTYEVRRRR